MAGYIGSKSSVTQVDGYNRTEADAEFVAKAGGTMTGAVTIDADGATALTVDRATSDGTIIDVQKNGTSVGSIGSSASGQYLHIGSDDVGLTFAPNVDSIIPFNVGTGAYNANVDLGYSAGTKFRNIYLNSGVYVDTGGGVYLGGTGAANKLDDYEEGTWTPVGNHFNLSSVAHATYVKIGKTVTLQCWVNATNGSGSVIGAEITGLPFTSVTYSVGGVDVSSANSTIPRLHCRSAPNSTVLYFVKNNDEAVPAQDIDAGHIIFSITYETNS